MSRMIVQVYPANPDEPLSGSFHDGDVPVLLESCVRALVQAEAAVRKAQADLDRWIAACRKNGQGGMAEAALKGLAERRRGAI